MPQSQDNDTIELTSDEVRTITIETLINHLNLVVNGYKLSTEDIWNVVVAAAAQGQAIESAANQLEDAPAPSTVRLLPAQRVGEGDNPWGTGRSL